jgi:hypothetical protein
MKPVAKKTGESWRMKRLVWDAEFDRGPAGGTDADARIGNIST